MVQITKLRFSGWPFPSFEEVVLYWLRSPRMTGTDKQWMMTAVFRRPSGELVDMDLPWGMLSSLRLGSIYQNGVVTTNERSLRQLIISFSEDANYDIRRTGDVLPNHIYPLHTHANLSEMCLRVRNNGYQIIVPTLEIIRAFFCPNKLMAESVLQPDGLSNIVSTGLYEGQLTMKFDPRTPYHAVRPKYIVALIAKILFDEDWYESWKRVWHQRRGLDEVVVPLTCAPPILQGTEWRVEGLVYDRTVLVKRIVSTSSISRLPFRTIQYSHPNSRDTRNIVLGGQERFVTRGKIDELTAVTTPNIPTTLTQPMMVPVKASEHKDASNLIIAEQGAKPTLRASEKGNKAINRQETVLVSPKEVSFFQEAGKGKVTSGEFHPLTDFSQKHIPPSMLSFFQAINSMQLLYGLECSYFIKDTPVDSPVALLAIGSTRVYGLVSVGLRDQCAYILEVDGSDGHSMSTLIFLDSMNSPKLSATTLLEKYVTVHGVWDRPGVEKFLRGMVRWSRHREDTRSWGGRLALKAIALMGMTQ